MCVHDIIGQNAYMHYGFCTVLMTFHVLLLFNKKRWLAVAALEGLGEKSKLLMAALFGYTSTAPLRNVCIT